MKFEQITNENLALAVKVQNEIFPTENGELNYIESINKNSYRKEIVYWLVLDNDKPIGISGLYSYSQYPNDAWLGWFGVLKQFRGKGYGSKIFDHFENFAREKGYKNIRLYTDLILNHEAVKLYYKKGMISEKYDNKDEDITVTESILIFSKSLTNNNIELWNNKFIELTEQVNKESSR